jgi:membrane protein DedA with SNARE-associated domain
MIEITEVNGQPLGFQLTAVIPYLKIAGIPLIKIMAVLVWSYCCYYLGLYFGRKFGVEKKK